MGRLEEIMKVNSTVHDGNVGTNVTSVKGYFVLSTKLCHIFIASYSYVNYDDDEHV